MAPSSRPRDPRAPRNAPSRRGPALRKSLGQHHLVDGKLCRPLVDFLGAGRDTGHQAPSILEPSILGPSILEIGPGGGVLTRELLATGAGVVAWELDAAWAAELPRRLGAPACRRLHLVVADALELPWTRLPAGMLVAGNLPYNVATVLLRRMLELAGTRVARAAVLVQYEVALRLAAEPGSRDYGALSVLVAARADVRLLGRVKPGSFRPPPKVDSAFVGLLPKAPPLPEAEMPAFTATVQAAFAQRRKKLCNALSAGKAAEYGKVAVEQALESAGLEAEARAEQLGLNDFLRLHGRLQEVGKLVRRTD